MKVLKYNAPFKAEIIETQVPEVTPTQVLAKTLATNVSAGTEMAFYRGTAPQINSQMLRNGLWKDERESIKYPMQSDDPGVWWMGYSSVSQVVKVGSEVNDLKIGDIIFKPSSHKEYQIIENNYLKIPETMTPAQASFLSLTDIAFNGVLDSGVKLMDNVVIIGMGAVGQLTLQMCKAAGAFVIAVDFLDNRLKLATKLGADMVVNPKTDGDIAENVIEILGGRADAVIEATGNSRALSDSVRCVRNEGQVTVVSFYQAAPDNFQMGREFHHNRVIIRSSQVGSICPALRHQYDMSSRRATALKLLQKLDVDSLISHRCQFEEYPKMLEKVSNNPSDCQSIVIEY